MSKHNSQGASDIKELERVHRLLTEAITQELEFIIDWNNNLESIREAWDKDSGLPYPTRVNTPPSLIAAVSKFLVDNNIQTLPATVDELDELRATLSESRKSRKRGGQNILDEAIGLEDLH